MSTPAWLHDASICSVVLGAACSILAAADVVRHPQRMWIMNVVWPATASFGTLGVLWLYFRYGRATIDRDAPLAVSVATGTLHCGSGCVLGDLLAEGLLLAFPAAAVWFGWHSLFRHRIFAGWVLDYLLAYALGIAFQYFAIVPMRKLTPARGLAAAAKADTLSLTAWQIGMYGFMALAHFYLFATLLGIELRPGTLEFWCMMQIAMLGGFATAYPVNWWLIRSGIKEAM